MTFGLSASDPVLGRNYGPAEFSMKLSLGSRKPRACFPEAWACQFGRDPPDGGASFAQLLFARWTALGPGTRHLPCCRALRGNWKDDRHQARHVMVHEAVSSIKMLIQIKANVVVYTASQQLW